MEWFLPLTKSFVIVCRRFVFSFSADFTSWGLVVYLRIAALLFFLSALFVLLFVSV